MGGRETGGLVTGGRGDWWTWETGGYGGRVTWGQVDVGSGGQDRVTGRRVMVNGTTCRGPRGGRVE